MQGLLSLRSAKSVRESSQGAARAEAADGKAAGGGPKSREGITLDFKTKVGLRETHGSVMEPSKVQTPNDPKLSDGGAWRGACPTVERMADAQI